MPMTDFSISKYPAFIQALSENGTRAETLRALQETWNELLAVKVELSDIKIRLFRYENFVQKLSFGTSTRAMPK
jgi:hypothetical protein